MTGPALRSRIGVFRLALAAVLLSSLLATAGYADKAFAARAKKLASSQKTDRLTVDARLEKDGDGNWSFADPGTLGAVLLDGYDQRQEAEQG